jgi:predicted trehalose synthase
VTSLERYLPEQRWFASKAREIGHCEVLEEIALPAGPRIAFVEVVFGAGTHETYQLLLDDAGEDVLARRADVLLELIRAGAEVRGGESVVRFRALGPLPATPGATRPIGAEQSNTTVVFGDALALKAYRRIEPGVNPDLEITRFLAERGFAAVPALHGYYEVSGRTLDATLGLAQAYVAGGRNGWELALDELGAAPERFLGRLRALGETIGAMHAVLASDAADPAFAPGSPRTSRSGC